MKNLILLILFNAAVFAQIRPVGYDNVTRNVTPADLDYVGTSANFTTLQQNGVGVVDINRTLTAGAGLSGGGDLSANRAFTLDPSTFVNNITWWNGSQATRTWTFSLSGATDPVITFGNNLVNITTGALQVGGNAVMSPASPAQGDIAYFNGTAWVPLTPGVSGQFLQTLGPGANPLWADGGSGTDSNWNQVGTTNSSLPGVATAHEGVFTNGVQVGTPSVTYSGSGTGTSTVTANGGEAEDLSMDLGGTANTGVASSSTGLNLLDYGTAGIGMTVEAPGAADNSERVPTTAWVNTAIAAGGGGSGDLTDALFQAFGIGGHGLSMYRSTSAGTTFNAFGDAPSNTGTASQTAVDANQPQGLNFVSAGASGDDAGVAGVTIWHFSRSLQYATSVRLMETNAVRAWIGFTSSTLAQLVASSDPASANIIGFRYLDSISPNWFFCTKDATTITAADTGIPANLVVNNFAIKWDTTNAVGYINGVAVRTNSANLPLSVACRFATGIEAQEAAAKNVRSYTGAIISHP